LSSQSISGPEPAAGAGSRWSLFGSPAFTIILIATSASNVGIAMFDTAASWLMTGLNPDPMMVSAVQIATTLPMFLLTIPAGALSDIVDARRLLLGAQIAVTAVGVAFAAIVSLHLATPQVLLAATFILGALGALSAPGWLLITPMLVSKDNLDGAIAVNNTSYNISRAVGPAIGGFAIAAISIDFPLWCYCVFNLALAAAVFWWRAPRRIQETLPAERFASAIRTGLRYVRNNRAMDSTIIRAMVFFLFASAYWALLPLVARTQMHNGAAIYGVLLGMIGLGSLIGSLGLNWLKERLGPDRMALLASGGTVAALVMFGAARSPSLAIAASLIAGASWIVMMTTLFVSAQVALPEWVRGRGLAIFLSAYFGAMTLGSAIWGKVASAEGLPATFYIAAAAALLGTLATARRRLQTAAALDLSPSMHWRAPVFARMVRDDRGPILVTIENHIDPKDRGPFLALMREIGFERKRDGAYAWNIFEDSAEAGRMVETFLIATFLELKHLRARVTHADRMIEEAARRYLLQPPKLTFLVTPKRSRQKRRKFVRRAEPLPAD
jgi:predicted MFS family arabinose efflux permease